MPDALTLTLSHGEREQSRAAFSPFATGRGDSPERPFPFSHGEWEQSGAAFFTFLTVRGDCPEQFYPLGHRVRGLYSLSLWERAGVRAPDRTFSKENR